MSYPTGPENFLEEIRTAIDQLRPELPQLLGPDYPAFEAQLQTLLQQGKTVEVMALFGRSPAAHQRLSALRADIRRRKEEVTKGIDLLPTYTAFGPPVPPPPVLAYWCALGHHKVYQAAVKKNDIRGRPLCPEHRKPLTSYPPIGAQ